MAHGGAGNLDRIEHGNWRRSTGATNRNHDIFNGRSDFFGRIFESNGGTRGFTNDAKSLINT